MRKRAPGRRERGQAKPAILVHIPKNEETPEIGFVPPDDYGRLKAVVEMVRFFPQDARQRGGEPDPAWGKIDRIIRLVAERTATRERSDRRILWVPSEAISLFNELAAKPIQPYLRLGAPGGRGRALVTGPQLPVAGGEAASLALLIYTSFFLNPKATRVKVCEHCQRVFIDRSKGNRALRCSPTCTWRRWSRAARKAAHHGRKEN